MSDPNERHNQADDMALPARTEAADDYEYAAATMGAFALGSAYVAFRFIETGHSLTSTKPIASTAAAFVLSVGSAFFWGKSQDYRHG